MNAAIENGNQVLQLRKIQNCIVYSSPEQKEIVSMRAFTGLRPFLAIVNLDCLKVTFIRRRFCSDLPFSSARFLHSGVSA